VSTSTSRCTPERCRERERFGSILKSGLQRQKLRRRYALFSVQLGIDILVPDEVEDVAVQRDRGEFLRGLVAADAMDTGERDGDGDDDDARAAEADVVLHDRDDGPYHAHWLHGALLEPPPVGAGAV
jgi:hypothetical protein